MNDEWGRSKRELGRTIEWNGGLALALFDELMNVSLRIQGGGNQMRNTIYGTMLVGNWSECQDLHATFAGVVALVGYLSGCIHCG
jgi:hypothetical protein